MVELEGPAVLFVVELEVEETGAALGLFPVARCEPRGEQDDPARPDEPLVGVVEDLLHCQRGESGPILGPGAAEQGLLPVVEFADVLEDLDEQLQLAFVSGVEENSIEGGDTEGAVDFVEHFDALREPGRPSRRQSHPQRSLCSRAWSAGQRSRP